MLPLFTKVGQGAKWIGKLPKLVSDKSYTALDEMGSAAAKARKNRVAAPLAGTIHSRF